MYQCSWCSFDTLLITGGKSRTVKESEEIHKQVSLSSKAIDHWERIALILFKVRPGACSLIRLDDVEDVLEETPEKLADSLILFCQVAKSKPKFWLKNV